MIPTTNIPAHVTGETTSAINRIITNSAMHTGFKSEIIKTEISNYLLMFICYKYIAEKEDTKKEFKYKRRFSDQSIGTFKLRLRDIN